MLNNPVPSKVPNSVRKIYRYLLTGALALGPIGITLFLLWKSFLFLDKILAPFINVILRKSFGIQSIPGLGLLVLLIVLIITGYSARRVGGKWMLSQSKQLLSRIPLVNRIYQAVEQISSAIFSGQREVFKKAVLIEYPRKGVYSIGIMTADTTGLIQDCLPEDSLSVFIPTTPNPTSGFLLFIPKREIIELDISVENALKMIISAGTVDPAERWKTSLPPSVEKDIPPEVNSPPPS
ncbi:MAG: DUF502 domain-containing protein [Candidatus Electryoneaceae bacterium]|nr:DUF502 domain-containing protein [Candidatus Electryoneaceae bacterium]